jgi:hypothetical protein
LIQKLEQRKLLSVEIRTVLVNVVQVDGLAQNNGTERVITVDEWGEDIEKLSLVYGRVLQLCISYIETVAYD